MRPCSRKPIRWIWDGLRWQNATGVRNGSNQLRQQDAITEAIRAKMCKSICNVPSELLIDCANLPILTRVGILRLALTHLAEPVNLQPVTVNPKMQPAG